MYAVVCVCLQKSVSEQRMFGLARHVHNVPIHHAHNILIRIHSMSPNLGSYPPNFPHRCKCTNTVPPFPPPRPSAQTSTSLSSVTSFGGGMKSLDVASQRKVRGLLHSCLSTSWPLLCLHYGGGALVLMGDVYSQRRRQPLDA